MSKIVKVGLIVFVGIPILIGFLSAIFAPPKSRESLTNDLTTGSPKPSYRDDFKANVNFTGAKFVIRNLDDLDCQNPIIELNGGKYELEGYTLEVGKTYEVGAAQFTKKDGTRFNPFQTKPTDFFIICKGNNALWGATWLGNW